MKLRVFRTWCSMLALLITVACTSTQERPEADQADNEAFVGSSTCRSCHESFYQKWAPSHHGLAMQPFTPEFGRDQVTSQEDQIEIGDSRYRAVVEDGRGWIREEGPGGASRSYGIEYALGGKNIFYFLTRLERGRLQVLPLAYHIRDQRWFNSTGSMVRHFHDFEDEALDWRESPLTFNTSCYGCHVSQLSSNYDLETDSYRTVWTEPGINCETCHGPGGEHVRVCVEAEPGTIPEDLKIIRTSTFSVEQMNSMCASCHSKGMPLTPSFEPGSLYFDNFGLHTLEHPDYYPDGRDLGENYTYTSWRMSPCVQAGDFSCMHCHTSSGRNRHAGSEADNACLPCHEKHVRNPAEHSFHPADDDSSRCVSCHIPRTEFAHMVRHDHSMLPPTPATTIALQSPNACNICHADKTAEWADSWVRKWYPTDYQADALYRGRLVESARKEEWSKLSEMLEYVVSESREEVTATSLIRLLGAADHQSKWPVLLEALKDESPLVRAAAATGLSNHIDPVAREALAGRLEDDFRIVRIQAASALAVYPEQSFSPEELRAFRTASGELESYLRSRPDQWNSHYNLGNYYMDRGRERDALAAFQVASRLEPASILPLVNASMAHARLGQPQQAEEKLRAALSLEPESAIANYNLGLLLAEHGKLQESEEALRRAVQADPEMASAAFNLGILLAPTRPEESLQWVRQAAHVRPEDPRYRYTLAFYLQQQGETEEAAGILQKLIEDHPAYADAYALLGAVYEASGSSAAAEKVYRLAASSPDLPEGTRRQFEAKIRK